MHYCKKFSCADQKGICFNQCENCKRIVNKRKEETKLLITEQKKTKRKWYQRTSKNNLKKF